MHYDLSLGVWGETRNVDNGNLEVGQGSYDHPLAGCDCANLFSDCENVVDESFDILWILVVDGNLRGRVLYLDFLDCCVDIEIAMLQAVPNVFTFESRPGRGVGEVKCHHWRTDSLVP